MVKLIRTSRIVILCILIASWSAFAAGKVIDLTNMSFTTSGGTWSVGLDAQGLLVQQDRATGGNANLWFDLELPDKFIFEAEFGVIRGNDRESRPYFGIVFNAQEDPQTGGYARGYRYAFHPQDPQYRLERLGGGGRVAAFTAPEAAQWEWDLAEWRTLRVVRQGSRMELYADDQLVIEFTDSTYTKGTVGFWTFSTSAIFRKLRLIDLTAD